MGLWLVAAYVVAPQLIRSAYEGTSAGFINALISGQAYHPVERYLAAAGRMARLGTLGLALAAVAFFVAYGFRGPLGRAASAVCRRPPRAGLGQLLLASVSLGVFFGLLEAGSAWIRFRAAGHLTTFNNPDALWMAPLALAAFFATLTLIAFLATWGWREGLATRVIVTICVTIGVLGVVRGLRFGLHPLAVWAVSVGLGLQLGRVMDRRPALWRALGRGALPALAVVALVPLFYTGTTRYRVEPKTGPAPSGPLPNVLLLVLDTVRGESLGLGGYERPTSPNLDRLGQDGVVFERAIAPSPWTLPTHATLFTGRYTHETGVAWDRALPETFPTLAEALGRLGYARGGFVANTTNAGRGTGLERGFNHYVDHPRSFGIWITSAYVTRRLAHESWPRLPARWQSIDRKYAPHVNREFLDWVDDLGGAPFFAFLNYLDAHAPYEGHEGFRTGFRPDNRSRVFGLDGQEREAEGALARDIDAYDSSIALIDHHIGALLDDLEERGLLANTLVVITSDHGEHLGERGLMDHGNSLYSQLLVVPMIVHWPGHVPEGVRVAEAVSLRDFPATVLDLLGVRGSAFPGATLAGSWDTAGARPGPALAEVEAAPHGGFHPGPNTLGDMAAIVDGSLHYILNGDGREELFDLAVDARGRNDLANTELGRRELPRLRALLDEVLASTGPATRSDVSSATAGGG